MPTYTCLCCGHTETFESPVAAYHAGWDVAPHFTLQPLCKLCPSAPVAIRGLEGARRRHAALHAAWQRDGRPTDFDIDLELAADGISGEEADEHKAEIETIRKVFESKKH